MGRFSAASYGKEIEKFPMLKLRKIAVEGFEEVVEGIDEENGLRCYIAIHSTQLGPALGGTRIYPYSTSDEALQDVLRLARAMTQKAAVAEVGLGGGKSVIIADPHVDKSRPLLHAFAQVINSLEGRYITAEDIGSDTDDMAILREATPYISCLATKKSSGDPSRFTAWGVFRGIEAVAERIYGSRSLEGKNVAIQGLGHVGSKLAELLFWHGAKLTVADVEVEILDRYMHDFNARVVQPNEIFGVTCDIFAPCAMGGVINKETIPMLRCKAVAGAANNQLQEIEDGDRLFERGILYAPDYVINAGGLINAVAEFEPGGYNPLTSRAKTERIFHILQNIFATSEREEKPTSVVADELASYNLEHGIGKRERPIEWNR